jgi:predicted membrane protein
MENMDNQQYPRRSKGMWLGILILCAGVAILLKRLGYFIPGWIFSWPMMLIVIGFAVGVNKKFRDYTSIILIVIGLLFLARRIGWISFNLGPYIWPIGIILVGLFIIVRPRRLGNGGWRFMGADSINEDVIDSVAIFYGVEKNITSKNFKRGEVVNIFGGTDLNFTQADINGSALLEVVAIFGGVKIIVPADWDVQINVVHIFAGTGDKRTAQPNPGNKKVLMVTGTAIFGGIDIRSY